MSYSISLKLQPETHQRFKDLHSRLNAGDPDSLAKPLGENLADMACEIIDQIFGQMVQIAKSPDSESEKVIQQILEAIRKYMPWSVSFFGNDRLVPLIEHLSKTIRVEDESVYMTYPIEQQLTQQVKASSQKLAEGESREIANSLKLLTEVIDVGVTHLIREPKKSLKFNFVVDKTLNGVINMTTHLGYKRLEKLGTQLDQQAAATYVDHFLKFMRHPA